jgi:hypothetical protein
VSKPNPPTFYVNEIELAQLQHGLVHLIGLAKKQDGYHTVPVYLDKPKQEKPNDK